MLKIQIDSPDYKLYPYKYTREEKIMSGPDSIKRMESLLKMLEDEVNNETNVEALIIRRNNYTVLVCFLVMLSIHSNLKQDQSHSML